jgi:hypothetical protein
VGHKILFGVPHAAHGLKTTVVHYSVEWKGKVKLSRYRNASAKGDRKYSYYLFLTSALGGMSGQIYSPVSLYPREWTPNTYWIGGRVGIRADLHTEAGGKILCLCRRLNAGRQSVVRHYTVTYSGFSIREGTLLHSKSQYTTVKHSQQLSEHTYTSDPHGPWTLTPIEFLQQDLLWQSSNTRFQFLQSESFQTHVGTIHRRAIGPLAPHNSTSAYSPSLICHLPAPTIGCLHSNDSQTTLFKSVEVRRQQSRYYGTQLQLVYIVAWQLKVRPSIIVAYLWKPHIAYVTILTELFQLPVSNERMVNN